MSSTTTRRPRPEIALVEDCACTGDRCTLTGDCLEAALADERFGIWTRAERSQLRLAS